MALTEEFKTNWLSEDNNRIILMDLEYHDGISNKIIRFSNKPYIMIKGDSTVDPTDGITVLSNLIYDDIITSVPNISKSIDTGLDIGSITVLNSDGEYDYLLEYAFIGHNIKLYIGESTWRRDDFIIVFNGIVSGIDSTDPNNISINIKDKKEILNIELESDKIDNTYWENLMDDINSWSPTGYIQGERAYDRSKALLPDATKDTHLPICLGKVFNISPVLVDSWNHVYLIHEGEISEVIEVRANGVPLLPDDGAILTCTTINGISFQEEEDITGNISGSGTIFEVNHTETGSGQTVYIVCTELSSFTGSEIITGSISGATATITSRSPVSKQYEVNLNLGGATGASVLRLLDHDQNSQITCDIIGTTSRHSSVPGGSVALTTHSLSFILEWLILSESSLTFDNISQTTFPTFSNVSEMGFFSRDESILLDELNKLANSVGGYLIFDNENNTLDLFRFVDPENETVDLYLTEDDIIYDNNTGLSIANIEEPKLSITYGFKKNYTVQDYGNLAGSIVDIDSPYYDINKLNSYQNNYSTLVGYTNINEIQYPLAEHITLIESTIWDETEAETELNRRILLRSKKRKIFNINSVATSFTYNIGDIVNITFDRYNLNSINGLIISIEESVTDNLVILGVWI